MVVIGDGAVGLCATLAARRLGAGQIITLGHQPQRLTLARQFGASEVLTSGGEQVAGQVREMTRGGAEASARARRIREFASPCHITFTEPIASGTGCRSQTRRPISSSTP